MCSSLSRVSLFQHLARRFREYAAMVEAGVAARHGAVPHWAKAEIPEHPGQPPVLWMCPSVACGVLSPAPLYMIPPHPEHTVHSSRMSTAAVQMMCFRSSHGGWHFGAGAAGAKPLARPTDVASLCQ